METGNRLLEGKVCIVTGAGRGLGRGIAEQFAKDGAIVYVNARRNMDDWAVEAGRRYHTKIVPLYFDVTDTAAMKQAMLQVMKSEQSVDVLVNNAGITSNELIGMISYRRMQELFETNVFAAVEAIQIAARLMMRKRTGSIINISSIIGVEGGSGEMVYAGTKGALIAITKSAAKELAPYHIRVNSVAPGFADTDMFRNAAGNEDVIQKHISNIGFGRLAKQEDIAYACAFLASDRSEYITGQILGVNGGAVVH